MNKTENGINHTMATDNTYKQILKTTSLLGGVQVFNILTKMLLFKMVVLWMGADGMGILGLYRNTMQILQNGCGLGISQSAIRDVANVAASERADDISLVVSVTKRLILLTSFLGLVVTCLLSFILSPLLFGNYRHVLPLCLLGIAVAFAIMGENQSAIMKGMRQFRFLAYASILGAIAGLIISIPCYYFLRVNGIVLSLILSSALLYFFSNLYVTKLHIQNQKISWHTFWKMAFPMIKLGGALMFSSQIIYAANLIIAAFIRKTGGMDEVGYYSAGLFIIFGCFGMITTAMVTDYYSRVAAVSQDNQQVEKELNSQIIVQVLFTIPIITISVLGMPVIIEVVYSKEFLSCIDFIVYTMFGMFLGGCCTPMEIILVAKAESKLFMKVTIFYRTAQVILSIFFYWLYGLRGIGFAQIVLAVLEFTFLQLFMAKQYGIRCRKSIFIYLGWGLLAILVSILMVRSNNAWILWGGGGLFWIVTCFVSLHFAKKETGVNILQKLKSKFNRRKNV